MSHELHYTDGRADFFEVGARRSAWHREGTLLADAPSYDEALAIAHLDYFVTTTPTYVRCGDATAPVYIPSRCARVTVRADTGVELGAVGTSYRPLQNRDAFRALEPLVHDGLVRLETGGVIRNGADAWLLARFDLDHFGPTCRTVFVDEVVPYALLSNNHDGRRHATVALTPIRVVCANTLGEAERAMDQGGRSIGVRHVGDAAARLADAAQSLFGAIVERYEILATQYHRLRTTVLDAAQFRSLVLDVAVPDPRRAPRWNPDARLATAVVDRYERRVATLTRLWADGVGHTGEPTAWYAYNAVVEAIDHDRDLWPTRGGVRRTASLLDGTLAATKRAVLGALVRASRN